VYKFSGYMIVIAFMYWPKRTYNNCVETHLGDAVISTWLYHCSLQLSSV